MIRNLNHNFFTLRFEVYLTLACDCTVDTPFDGKQRLIVLFVSCSSEILEKASVRICLFGWTVVDGNFFALKKTRLILAQRSL